MSCYIKLNGWAGDDLNGTTARFAKIFRMDFGKASRVMHKIIGGQNWQFQWPISHEQAKTARSYLRWLGFDLELNPSKHYLLVKSRSDLNSAASLPFSEMANPTPLNQLVELTGSISNAFTIALYKVNLDEKNLILRHHISLSSNFCPEVKIKFGEGVIGKVALSKQFIFNENITQNKIKLHFYKKEENLKSFLAVPVVYKKLEGVLVVDSKISYSFPAKQQKIITGLANQIGWHLNQERRKLS